MRPASAPNGGSGLVVVKGYVEEGGICRPSETGPPPPTPLSGRIRPASGGMVLPVAAITKASNSPLPTLLLREGLALPTLWTDLGATTAVAVASSCSCLLIAAAAIAAGLDMPPTTPPPPIIIIIADMLAGFSPIPIPIVIPVPAPGTAADAGSRAPGRRDDLAGWFMWNWWLAAA